jgi:phage terminase large subunit-like protein
VAGRPPKTLLQLVREASFRPGRHAHLLAGADLPWSAFARLQAAFRGAPSEGERDAILREFQAQIKSAHAELARRVGSSSQTPALDAALAALGRPGSFRQLERFFPHFLRHQAGERANQPFRLERFQRDFLREFWRRDKQGRRIYTVGLLGIPKGNGKTPLAAALGLHALVSETDAPEVYGIAGSKDQAGIAHRFARQWVEEGELANWVSDGKVLRCPQRNGFYKLLSSDGRLGHGVNPSAAIVDEWWLFSSERERESYNALARALHKRGSGRAWLLAITTAGFDKHAQLGQTYEKAINHPQLEQRANGFLRVLRDEQSGFLFWWYGLPEDSEREIDDLATVRACNPASWLDPHQLLRDLQRPDTDELDWRRLHLNQWTASRDAWLPSGSWARLRSDTQIPSGADIYLGVDIALRHDTSAVVYAHVLTDGRIALRCHTWSANDKAKAHQYVSGGQIRLELIEDFIRQLARDYRIREIAYDPAYFARSAQQLEDERFTMVEFLQASGPMSNAYQGFYQACREGTLTHDGDPILAAHIDATAADKTERGWKIRKLKSSEHIDACVAAVLAVARAQASTKRGQVPQIFWIDASP